MTAKHRHQQHLPAPYLPPSLQTEADALMATADHLLEQAVQGRRRAIARHAADLLLAPTLRRRCAAMMADPDLASLTLALRLIGQRLHSIGGCDLLEVAVARLAPEDAPHAELRHDLSRAAWNRIGEHVA